VKSDDRRTIIPHPGDTENALAAVVALRDTADKLEFDAVQRAVDSGWSWGQIAEALGVTRQAVHKKYAHRNKRPR
jgi:hypothetical protein